MCAREYTSLHIPVDFGRSPSREMFFFIQKQITTSLLHSYQLPSSHLTSDCVVDYVVCGSKSSTSIN